MLSGLRKIMKRENYMWNSLKVHLSLVWQYDNIHRAIAKYDGQRQSFINLKTLIEIFNQNADTICAPHFGIDTADPRFLNLQNLSADEIEELGIELILMEE